MKQSKMSSYSKLSEQTDQNSPENNMAGQGMLIGANTFKDKLRRTIKEGLDHALVAFVNGGTPVGCWPVPW